VLLAIGDHRGRMTTRETNDLGLLRDGTRTSSSYPDHQCPTDSTRPESRLTRLLVDHALSGPVNPTHQLSPHIDEVSTPGSRYID